MSGTYEQVKVCTAKRREWFNSFKEGQSCRKCGIVYPPYVLDWHHKNPKEKLFNLSKASFRVSRSRLLAEMAKCELLCANCHRITEFQLRCIVLEN